MLWSLGQGNTCPPCSGVLLDVLVFLQTIMIAWEELGRRTRALISSQLWTSTSTVLVLLSSSPRGRRIQKRGQGHVPVTRGHPVRPLEEPNLQRGLTGLKPTTQRWPGGLSLFNWSQTQSGKQTWRWKILSLISHKTITNCESYLLYTSASFILSCF